MIIYIMRHGETNWNVDKRLQGRADIELNQNGVEMAVKSGEGMRGIAFAMAFTSPLKRARQTAELVLQGRDVPIEEDQRLIEIGFGEYEGMNYLLADEKFNYFFTDPQRYQPPAGGEQIADMQQRVGDFLTDITGRAELQDKTILVTTHGAAGRAMVNLVRKTAAGDFWSGRVPGNCSVQILEAQGGKIKVIEEGRVFY